MVIILSLVHYETHRVYQKENTKIKIKITGKKCKSLRTLNLNNSNLITDVSIPFYSTSNRDKALACVLHEAPIRHTYLMIIDLL